MIPGGGVPLRTGPYDSRIRTGRGFVRLFPRTRQIGSDISYPRVKVNVKQGEVNVSDIGGGELGVVRVRYDRTKQEMRILKLVYGSSEVYKMSIIMGDAVSHRTERSV